MIAWPLLQEEVSNIISEVQINGHDVPLCFFAYYILAGVGVWIPKFSNPGVRVPQKRTPQPCWMW